MKKIFNFLKKTTTVAVLCLLVSNAVITIPMLPNEVGICTLSDSDAAPTPETNPFNVPEHT